MCTFTWKWDIRCSYLSIPALYVRVAHFFPKSGCEDWWLKVSLPVSGGQNSWNIPLKILPRFTLILMWWACLACFFVGDSLRFFLSNFCNLSVCFGKSCSYFETFSAARRETWFYCVLKCSSLWLRGFFRFGFGQFWIIWRLIRIFSSDNVLFCDG